MKGMSGEGRGDVGFEGCVGLCQLMFTRTSAKSSLHLCAGDSEFESKSRPLVWS